MREGAAEVVKKNDFTLVPEAEKNIKTFADTLLAKADTVLAKHGKNPPVIRITERTLYLTLHGHVSHGEQIDLGLCPLFPIC
jgi:hypothetical protein